jgi:Type II restriction enzyme SfiI
MFIDPQSLEQNLPRLEEIERASLRLVTQAVLDFRETAAEIFAKEPDLVQDFGEDITREALDRMGVSRIDQRLFGKIDYKRARYVFHPEYAIRQALFVDSKAEKVAGASTATIQTAQTSLRIRHIRANQSIDEEGKLPRILTSPQGDFLTTTIFVKYNYRVVGLAGGGADEGVGDDGDEETVESVPELKSANQLVDITVAALPNGILQDFYNPTVADTIWRAGRNAPSLGEPFRVRLVFALLKAKAAWRVQKILAAPTPFAWDE